MATIDDSNYRVGGVELYFSATVGHASLYSTAGGKERGAAFRNAAHNLGNIVTSEISTDVTYLEHFITVTGKRRRDKVVANMESLSISFTFDEINEENMQKAFLASELTKAGMLAPLMKPTQRGSASLKFRTETNASMVYSIPKVTIRPDGPMSIGDGTDWWSQPMIIDAEYCATADWWASKPYGYIQI